MSLYQAVVLLLFNETEGKELGFGEIKVGAGMGECSTFPSALRFRGESVMDMMMLMLMRCAAGW